MMWSVIVFVAALHSVGEYYNLRIEHQAWNPYSNISSLFLNAVLFCFYPLYNLDVIFVFLYVNCD